jgi:hypothetical protein
VELQLPTKHHLNSCSITTTKQTLSYKHCLVLTRNVITFLHFDFFVFHHSSGWGCEEEAALSYPLEPQAGEGAAGGEGGRGGDGLSTGAAEAGDHRSDQGHHQREGEHVLVSGLLILREERVWRV